MHRLSEDQRQALFRARTQRGPSDPQFVKRMTRGGPLRAWLPRLAHLAWGCRTERLETARYVFSGNKYRRLIEALPPEQVAIVGMRPAQLRYARNQGIPAQSVFEGHHALARNFPTLRDPDALDRVFDSLVQAMSGEPDRTLVLQTDQNPINRLLLFAARAAGLRSVCIQHGIFARTLPSHFGDGWYADFTMVYDHHQQSVLVERGLDRARLPILGFCESPVETRLPPPAPGRERRVCFIGQPFRRVDQQLGIYYVALLRKVFSELRSAGLEAAYKPHPREGREPDLSELGASFAGSMQQAIERFDVFISMGSTGLLEATLAGRVAIQLRDDHLVRERLDEAPYAHGLPVEQQGELPRLCLEAPPVDNPELALLNPQQLAARFVGLVEQLGPSPAPYQNPPV